MRKITLFVLIVAFTAYLIPFFCLAQTKRPSYQPKKGFVPDHITAIAIAQTVWTPIYGKDNISRNKPFKTTLVNGVWTVKGSLPRGTVVGGVPIAEISKIDGRILKVIHTK